MAPVNFGNALHFSFSLSLKAPVLRMLTWICVHCRRADNIDLSRHISDRRHLVAVWWMRHCNSTCWGEVCWELRVSLPLIIQWCRREGSQEPKV